MKLVRSIHDNHKDLPEEVFWTRDSFEKLSRGDIFEWTPLTTKAMIRFGKTIESIEQFLQLLKDEWPKQDFQLEGTKLRKMGRILVIESSLDHGVLEEELLNFWYQLPPKEQHIRFLVYNWSTNEEVNPFATFKISFRDFFRKREIRKMKRVMQSFLPEILLLSHLKNGYDLSETDFEKARIKPKELEKWKQRLEKVDLYDKSEPVLGLGRLRLRRNHWRINSNFNRSGKFFFTPSRLVLVRRKFMIFGFSITALRPLEAFVRPANKIFVFFRMIYHYVSEPLKGLIRARPAFAPALAGFAVYFSLLADRFSNIFAPFLEWLNRHFSWSFPNFKVAFDFALQNPELITGLAGTFAFIRLGILKTFFRGEELVVLPFKNVNYLLMENNMVFGRWKVKGSKLVGASEGIEYKIVFFDQEIAVRFFISVLEKPNEITKELEEEPPSELVPEVMHKEELKIEE